MQHDEFIGQVQHRAHLASRGEAEKATRATLTTLGQRLSVGAAANLAAQLPGDIGRHLHRDGPETEPGDQFTTDAFFARVAAIEQVDRPAAVFHSRVVLEVTDEATTGNLLGKIRQQLPDDFDRVLDAGSTGTMPREH